MQIDELQQKKKTAALLSDWNRLNPGERGSRLATSHDLQSGNETKYGCAKSPDTTRDITVIISHFCGAPTILQKKDPTPGSF